MDHGHTHFKNMSHAARATIRPARFVCMRTFAYIATQEAISRYVQGGDRVFMCLYDLSKAFDSVEYSVLLRRLVFMAKCGE